MINAGSTLSQQNGYDAENRLRSCCITEVQKTTDKKTSVTCSMAVNET